ncbi:biopolymer transporter ExbD [Thioalkalivibrio denitrificans]|uniref:Biopolymer transporter ExbD n=1 Tax=Thioalkalivibrio denitrificans TaxID=108003 RepID=A0A1V3NTH4_9GAMM|nr:biopolymer transporter ExbD [Thioalkalivibrio denitrificans]OOG28142.1 biopolymer transporter ExbD [Thioalkalivibrio denitrificans]
MAGGLLGDEDQPLSEMNVVPLVDVILVLLVMFIIAAPIFAQALNVDLPRAEASPGVEPQVAHLVLYADGKLMLEERAVHRDALPGLLSERLREEPQLVVRLGADASVPYQSVAELVSVLQTSGVRRIAFATRSP